ncbi:MAG: hypothetical protein KC900_13060 [Candidatus Omnitrophica bacterium]|nr:hypothetical protein [Candidatus Omnitrophota bacterium]
MGKKIALMLLIAAFVGTGTGQAYYKGSYGDDEKGGDEKQMNMGTVTASSMEEGYLKTALPYPTGNKATSTVVLEKHFPQKAVVGQKFTYMIKVINLTAVPLEEVVVSEQIPENFTISMSEPAVESRLGGKTTWKVGTLAPNGSSVIKVTGTAADRSSAPCCAKVDYKVPALCHTTILEQPAVELSLDAPAATMVCDTVKLDYTVKNTGDSVLRDLKVSSELPEGATSLADMSTIEFDVKELGPGESETISKEVQIDAPGQYRFVGSVKGEYVSDLSNVKYTKVSQPTVDVDIRVARDQQYLGRDLTYTIDVKNTSSVDAESTMVVAEIPRNAKFKSASDDGRHVEDIVGWEVGNLKAYETKKLTLVLTAADKGEAKTKVGVQATCCDPVTDTASSKLVGIPALLLEVVDVVDPIEVGEIQTYDIKVTNQGTADANNVVIKAMFDGMEYVAAEGETSGRSGFNTVDFDPVTHIGPKEVVKWKVNLKGKREGDLRFKVILNSDELTAPVEEAESTFVY